MPARNGPVHVVTTRRTYQGRVYETHLLRRTYREDGKVKNETLGNLSHLPGPVIDLVRRALHGETFVPAAERFQIITSRAHGAVHAVLRAMHRLGLRDLLSSRPCREADLVLAMIAARIVAPHTKLATTRWWHTQTLAQELKIEDADEDDLYAAMDWLLERQSHIEKKLAARHLATGSLALFDASSSYFEGSHCPLGRIGHNRDGKRNKLQVNYGLLTDRRGCPVAISVYPGNTADSATLMPEVATLRERFGLTQIVLVGDRGMIGQATVESLRGIEGLAWITALKTPQIRSLVEGEALQLGLFDERNLFEFAHPDYPGERLIACRNDQLGALRAHKRAALIEATRQELDVVRGMVEKKRLRGADKIGVRIGRVINKYKVAKHFDLAIHDDRFVYRILDDSVAAEAALDGVYVIRTPLPVPVMSSAEAVRSYKSLAQVERAFRSLKTIDLKIRPIHHRLADRVRAHILLCMLAYYVEWHLREAWRPILFADEDLVAKVTRDPVAPAKRSEQATQKAQTHTIDDGSAAHSFRTLLEELATVVRNTCRLQDSDTATFELSTTPSAHQKRALDLVDTISV